MLELEEFEIICVNSIKKAWDILHEGVAVVVLDLMMPDISGRDFLKEFRTYKKFNDTHVIVITAEDNNGMKVAELFKLGANDYIQKPFSPAEFVSRVRNLVKLFHLTRLLRRNILKLNKRNNQLSNAIKNEEYLNKRILSRTMSLKKANKRIEKLNAKLMHTSTHDKLTEVYNREAILTFLQNDIRRAKRVKSSFAFMMIDLDHFKKVNDTYGHLVGDEVLCKTTYLIKQNIREIDLMGRYGGEEFIIILPDTNIEQAKALSERILNHLRNNLINVGVTDIQQTISIGLTAYKENESVEELIGRADKALYEAKNSGRNKFIAIA